MEKGFEILPHTADMRLRVSGNVLEDLFRNALRGVASYMKPEVLERGEKELREVREINVEAVDINSLLIEFLSEVIAESDIHNTVFPSVSFRKFGENFLEGTLAGMKVDGFEKDIKAVSYHEVDIKKNAATGLYETVLVFDI